MDGMMRAWRIETAGDGITINGVAPGWIATGSSTESERCGLHTPPGRAGSPDEGCGGGLLFGVAGSFLHHGASVGVDGGNILQENKGP